MAIPWQRPPDSSTRAIASAALRRHAAVAAVAVGLVVSVARCLSSTSVAMASERGQVVVLRDVRGADGRANDVVYAAAGDPSCVSEERPAVVYFGGDVQDLRDRMESAGGGQRRWAKKGRALEDTVSALAATSSAAAVVAVRPARMANGGFSCYDNFLPCDAADGAPARGDGSRGVAHGAARHLMALLTSVAERTDFSFHPVRSPKVLIGFSKGVVVLNQLVHELGLNASSKRGDGEDDLKAFSHSLRRWCWWDGGHEGRRNGRRVYPTDEREALRRLVVEVGADVDVRVTPYQVRDRRRPWIGTEESEFVSLLSALRPGSVERELFFGEREGSLEDHFAVLDTARTRPIKMPGRREQDM